MATNNTIIFTTKENIMNSKKIMTAQEAIDHLKPLSWAILDADVKLSLLKLVRANVDPHLDQLAQSDTKAKKWDVNNPALLGLGYQATVVPIIGQLNAIIDLYESIIQGKMMHALSVTHLVGKDRHDLLVYPNKKLDKLLYSDRQDYLRVKGNVKQVNPLTKNGGIVAVLGAGNYSSAVEMVKALFLENCAVVHKPHPINAETDLIWAQIFAPLVEIGALSFCDCNAGEELTTHPLVNTVYFTGSSATANLIASETSANLISECGGNNPFFIVPSDRTWTKKEIEHQALTIITMAKFNGGAVCGRPQTIVTSKNWKQRDEFLTALKSAIKSGTAATPSYYPNSSTTFANFQKAYPNAEVIVNDDAKTDRAADMLFIEDVEKQGFATSHEAFCLILDEVALDTPASAREFMLEAVEFANNDLLGTLACAIIIDDQTLANHRSAIQKSINDLQYGAIGVNTMPPFIFLNPYLTWGGCEEGKELVSGHGNFGNLLCYENVEKSFSFSKFMSPGHMSEVNKKAWLKLSKAYAKYTANPTIARLVPMFIAMLQNNLKKKDF